MSRIRGAAWSATLRPQKSSAFRRDLLAWILLRPRWEKARRTPCQSTVRFVSFYCNLHCEHCYVPEEYRDQYKQLLEPSQLSVEEVTDFIDLLADDYSLRKVSLTGGEPLLKFAFPRTAAVMAHANKRGLQVQLNAGGLGQVPIPDVV